MRMISYSNFIIFFYSFIFNLRYLPLRTALKIPILISPKIKIDKLGVGRINFSYEPHFGDIKIGLNISKGIIAKKGYLSISKEGSLTFRGRTKLYSGISIRIDRGNITFGPNSFVNGNCMFRCTRKIILGERLLVGWNVSFSTDDGHRIIDNGKEKEKEKNIIIGDHVWIASDSKIAKGVIIADGCVVAQNSLVISCFKEKNLLIGGVPAHTIKNHIEWRL